MPVHASFAARDRVHAQFMRHGPSLSVSAWQGKSGGGREGGKTESGKRPKHKES